MFSIVRKIFALFSINQSQLHKRYPPAEVEAAIDEEK